MIYFQANRALALALAAFSAFELATGHSEKFRLSLLLYSSILIAMVTTYAMRNLVGQDRYRRFGALLLPTSLGIYLFLWSNNVWLLAVGWSLSGLGATALVNHANNERSRRALRGMRFWFILSDCALWGAVILAHAHQLDLINAESTFAPVNLKVSIAILLAVAGIIRSGGFPAMMWLIRTSEAPSPLSAFLHAGIVNGFGYLLVTFPVIREARVGIISLALLTIFLALVVLRHRHDEKGKLANGTSMQMAFMALEGVLGLSGAVLLHIVGHGSYKSWSFLRAGGVPLRKKNSMPLTHSRKRNPAKATFFILLYVVTMSFSFFQLQSDHLLNFAVLSVALTSTFIFINKLPDVLLVPATLLSLVITALYIVLIHTTSQIYPAVPGENDCLALIVAISILLMTGLLRVIPRTKTLWIASLVNGYLTVRLRSKTPIEDLQSHTALNLTEKKVEELVSSASSPFVGGLPLSQIVAQDPLAGLHQLKFQDAAETARGYGISMYATSQQYLSWLEAGLIKSSALYETLAESGSLLTPDQLIQHSSGKSQALPPQHNRSIEKVIIRSSWWSSQSWSAFSSHTSSNPYQLWKEHSPRKAQCFLPDSPSEALAILLPHLVLQSGNEVSDESILKLVQQIISLDLGWFQVAKTLGSDEELSLLALRAVLICISGKSLPEIADIGFEHQEIWQEALEKSLLEDFEIECEKSQSNVSGGQTSQVTLATCIDVRSDVLRKAAEQLSGVQTKGMAGFFGVDVCLNSSVDQSSLNFAPIILEPTIEVRDQRRLRFLWSIPTLWKKASSGSGALAIAEGLGLLNGLLSLINTFAPGIARRLNRPFEPARWLDSTGMELAGLSSEAQREYARGILAVLDPKHSDLSSEVLFVGHGAEGSNTPFRSMYECGACGGNNGGLNARFAATLMNSPEVQRFLGEIYPGRQITFYAAEHNTTAGSLEIDPLARPQLQRKGSVLLHQLLRELSHLPKRPYPLAAHVEKFDSSAALAWWQPFPEWGLAGNAAVVIGPRSLTEKSELSSRVFLHDYRWEGDAEAELLSSILSGPGAVMQMINSAYNMAVTSPTIFSSGDKTRHNVLGEAGVLEGAEGPLLRGMPWQALSTTPALGSHNSQGHIPVRLQFLIDAPKEHIQKAIDASTIAPLVSGGWIKVHSLAKR